MAELKKVDIFSDGSCKSNPGPGGWAVILRYGEYEKELYGGEAQTTNNRMELTAAIQGLSALKEPCDVTLYSDSRYLVDSFEKKWIYSWIKNAWKKSDGQPVLNRELWEELFRLAKIHNVTFIWVKGHDGHPENERCDALAQKQASLFFQ